MVAVLNASSSNKRRKSSLNTRQPAWASSTLCVGGGDNEEAQSHEALWQAFPILSTHLFMQTSMSYMTMQPGFTVPGRVLKVLYGL
jgi:hypothetical protein